MIAYQWKRRIHKYGPPSDILLLGKIRVGETHMSVSRSSEFTASFSLTNARGEFPSESEAKEFVEKSLVQWLKDAGIIKE